MSAQRRVGSAVRIDNERLDYELVRRGISASELAEAAGLHLSALSRARTHRLNHSTLRKIAGALLMFPPIEGAEMVVTAPPSRELEPVEKLAAALA